MIFVLKFVLGILAGIAIGIGGSVYELTRASLSTEGTLLLASFAFSIGLILVCVCRLELFTSKVGFALDKFGVKIAVFSRKHNTTVEKSITFRKIISLPIILIGNVIGAYGYGILVKYLENTFASNADSLNEINVTTFNHGLMADYTWQSMAEIFILAAMCGVLVYFAAYSFRNFKNKLAKIIGIIIPVTMFVYLGTQHCIASCYYYGRYIGYDFELLSKNYQMVLASFGITVLGNMAGAILINAIFYVGKLFSRPKYKKG